MQASADGLLFSASDLANHLGCRHLTQQNLRAVRKEIQPPIWRDAKLEALQQRGFQHEEAHLAHLKDHFGWSPVRIDEELKGQSAVERTVALMREGVEVIVQASLADRPWQGRADILLKTDTPSNLGAWSYEVIDTKLARETKAETILQLCLYAELIEAIQGTLAERVGVVTPLSFEPEWYRTRDYLAYFRRVKGSLLAAVEEQSITYPEPCDRCEVCRWWPTCNQVWRKDDHLSLVAGISSSQRHELDDRGISTLTELANLPLPFKPTRGSAASYAKVREQARIQLEGRRSGQPKHELRGVEPGMGLARLPEPSLGDVFLDFEGDHFVGERGLEYLVGLTYRNADGSLMYEHRWAFTAAEERAALEWLVEFVDARREQFPDLHIYHFAPYEPAAIKRLMGAYATCEDKIDDWLRNHLFVDLYRVVRESLIASVERYSIKDLEPFFGFERAVPLEDARVARATLERGIELSLLDAVEPAMHKTVLGYNRDDCDATLALRDWLEGLRSELIASGAVVARPMYKEEEPKPPTEHQLRIRELVQQLTFDMPLEQADRSADELARWLLAHSLDYYWRERKVELWEQYRLRELPLEDYVDERNAVAGLELESEWEEKGYPVHSYSFPPQDCQLRSGDVYDEGGRRLGKLRSLDHDARVLIIEKTKQARDWHPRGIFAIDRSPNEAALEKSLITLAESVIAHGISGRGNFQAARDLLLRQQPRLGGDKFVAPQSIETIVEDMQALCAKLDSTVLPIQGPPGTGKTYLAARVILHLVQCGKKVGITSNSHPVIKHLLDGVLQAAAKAGVEIAVGRKGGTNEEIEPPVEDLTKNEIASERLAELSVIGGTKFMWARPEFAGSVDVLVVDEASQFSLADTLAVSPAAQSIILIGDPQQLERPQKGSHPDGVDVSPLDHLLAGRQTMPSDRGVFLPMTRRLHPSISTFTSEMFYESRLNAMKTLAFQVVLASGLIEGAGLFLLPVEHSGNQSFSAEEVEAVQDLIARLTLGQWIDRHGQSHDLGVEDILIVAPYNAQVAALRAAIPGARVGTVDKFQGQEAPVVIYSMTTSCPEDAPRGLDFLYSLNRLNVATSRAKCAAILVASPRLFDADCRTPKQMRLVNAMCRYLEVGKTLV